MDMFPIDISVSVKAMAVLDSGFFREEMAMAIFESVGTLVSKPD
jgi:hypothetical protein